MVVFSKKHRGDPGSASNNQIFLRKKMLWLYQIMELRHRLAISHQIFLKVQINTYKMKKNHLDTMKIDLVMRI